MINGISVVVCCYNSEKRISKVLSHLLNQKYDQDVNWEVLIVDNGSTDKTKEVSTEFWNHQSIKLRTVDEPNPGLSNARNKGLTQSVYDVVSFIDDDNWVETEWVQKVYHHMRRDPHIGILGGRGEGAFEQDPPAWFAEFQRSYAVGAQAESSGNHQSILYGAGLSIRKKAWNHLKSNGFKFILSDRKGGMITSGGDAELCLAVLLSGYKLYYDHDLKFKHYMPEARLNWLYLIDLHKSFGRATAVTDIYTSFHEKPVISRIKHQDPLLSSMNSVYNLIRILPQFARTGFSNKEGNRVYLRYINQKYNLKENFRLLGRYKSIVRELKNASWRINKPDYA